MGDLIRFPAPHEPAAEPATRPQPPRPLRRPSVPAEPEPLWREVLGERMRQRRAALGLRLVDVADLAGISVQYLSEVERGRKEPSSEIIAAVAGALETSLRELTGVVHHDLASRVISSSTSRGPKAMAGAA